ncbi:MAG: MerR family transcriptional regulator [Cytobacillus gottheilii]|uniref:MerR family transcriptional regulator n=1 Tax=Cytobacillus gottheilii TaxID=859144 RepID=UPI00249492EC|nr:MerR family transcriptional regulator [Cytobacillus gottheilii]
MTNQFTKAYTINEVSKQIGVPAGTLRQWEKDLKGLLQIPRSKNGARFYTDHEIKLLTKIKEMRDNNLSQKMIHQLLHAHLQLEASKSDEIKESENQITAIEKETEQASPPSIEEFKTELLSEIKNEIVMSIRKEVVDEVKREISKGALYTVKNLSDSIYKSSEKTKAEIHSLSDRIQQSSEQTSEVVGTLSKRVSRASKRHSEHFHALTKRISESSEASSEEFKTMIHYISSSAEVTSGEMSTLIETLNADREIYIESIQKEREMYWQQVREREDRFQNFIESFRKTAAAEEAPQKNWWQFWK